MRAAPFFTTNFAAKTLSMIALVQVMVASPIFAESSSISAKVIDEHVEKVKGEVGIAVVDTMRKKQFLLNQNKAFPMQSVCKLPLSIAILRLADLGKLSMQEKITVRKEDILDSYSPIKDAIKTDQTVFSIRNLMSRAIRESDNTACDLLIRRAGGPQEVTRLLKEAGIKGIRIDRPEGVLQPDSVKIARYLADPRDTAVPTGMVDMLQMLYTGKLLSKESTALILEDMFNCKTGQKRITAGLPKDWKLAHKTGTGKDIMGQNAATNDVGIMVGPNGETIYIAIFIKGARAGIDDREALMAEVAAKAIAGKL